MTKKRKLENLAEQLDDARKKRKVLDEKMNKLREGREKSERRERLIKELEELTGEQAKADADLKKHEDSDPEVLVKLEKEKKIFAEAANRWTDNIFALQSWCKNKFGIETEQLNKNFGIPEELDYVD